MFQLSFGTFTFTKTVESSRIRNTSADTLFVFKIESWEKSRHINTTNEEPDADTNAADFESKVSDCAAAFSPWEKDDWTVVLYNDLWYPGVVTDVRASLTLQDFFLENRGN